MDINKTAQEIIDLQTEFPKAQIPLSSAKFLQMLVILKTPKLILELGTSVGFSSIHLASPYPEVPVFTIERDNRKWDIAESFFKKAGLKNITLLRGEISEVLKSWNKKIDMLFIDADKRNYLNYMKTLEPFLNKNALIIADNAGNMKDKMKDYLDYVSSSPKYTSLFMEMDNGLMISIYSG